MLPGPPPRLVRGLRDIRTEFVEARCWPARTLAARQCLSRLRGHDLAASEVEPVQLTVRTGVFRVHRRGVPLIAKFHAEPAAFLREFTAIELLGSVDEPVAPRLVVVDEDSHLLVMEEIERALVVDDEAQFVATAAALGLAHGALRRHSSLLADIYGDVSLGRMHERLAASTEPDPHALTALESALERDGPECAQFTVGDFKWGHLRRRPSGSLAFIDLETLGPGLEAEDLLFLLNFLGATYRPDPLAWGLAIAAYLEARDGHRPSSTTVTHLQATVRTVARVRRVDSSVVI